MERKIAVVGLGNVGLPVAVAFGKKQEVVGFDISEHRINILQQNIDYTNEVTSEDLKQATIQYTNQFETLKKTDFIIVAVPTPIDTYHTPDLSHLLKASETVGKGLTKGAIVVYESTVYPGVTEDECIPVLEKVSGLKCGEDFFVGYSPERINPGDKEHTFTKVQKLVSAQTPEILDIVAEVYGSVVEAGVYKASSIKVAEAAKVIENTQRDVNIALMNELALIFDRMDIDTAEVLKAAGTKWNFVDFVPGLVGGHCIGVDPYYLTYKANSLGYYPEVILAGRRINDGMGVFVAQSLVKQMIKLGLQIQGSVVTVLGLTFKENVTDLRNSKVTDIIRELEEYGITVQVNDPEADVDEAIEKYGVQLIKENKLEPADAVILAVPHKAFLEKGWGVSSYLKEDRTLVVDIKSKLPLNVKPEAIHAWRL